MRTKRRMTASEFAAVRPLLKLSENRIEAARAALVDGETGQQIADRYGWTRQAVSDAVRSVWARAEEYRQSLEIKAEAESHIPHGWQKVELIAPTELIRMFQAEIAKVSPPTAKRKAPKKT